MDRNNASRQLLAVLGRLAICSASLALLCSLPAQADQLEQQSDLVNTYVTQMHADPLVASCAAHGKFIASTSSVLDHVEFPPTSFDSTHSSVTPWNDSFDEGKQRVKVDTIVTVDGVGIPQDSSQAPYDLKFRCGYVGQQILAFSWNDPVPPSRAHSEASGGGTAAHATGRHHGKTKKATGKGKTTRKSTSSHKSSATTKSSSKSATKSSKSTATKKSTAKKKSTTH